MLLAIERSRTVRITSTRGQYSMANSMLGTGHQLWGGGGEGATKREGCPYKKKEVRRFYPF